MARRHFSSGVDVNDIYSIVRKLREEEGVEEEEEKERANMLW